MTATTLTTHASSTRALRPSTLLLVAAIAFEVLGVRALAAGNADADAIVASIDGTSVAAPAAATGARIVAQAETPAR